MTIPVTNCWELPYAYWVMDDDQVYEDLFQDELEDPDFDMTTYVLYHIFQGDWN